MPHFGGSLLPSSDASTLVEQEGEHGRFRVLPVQELQTYVLQYHANPAPGMVRGWIEIASHPNGYSCKALADRILKAWKGECRADYALAQFRYILDCGGMGKGESSILTIIAGKW